MRCERYGKQIIKPWEEQDLILRKKFLSHASETGVSFNNMSYVKRNQLSLTDASKSCLGGFNPSSGKAWRFKIPTWMQTSMHINLLEFIAYTIGIWLEILDHQNQEGKYLKIKALTNNSSAVGWLYKSNFNYRNQGPHDSVARKLASLLLNSNSSVTAQQTPGSTNIIADSLSRDFHLQKNHLTFILKTLFPSQVPQKFQILEKLPKEITSLIYSLKA